MQRRRFGFPKGFPDPAQAEIAAGRRTPALAGQPRMNYTVGNRALAERNVNKFRGVRNPNSGPRYHLCHDCRKFTGSAFAAVIGLPKSAVTVTGALKSFT